MVKSLLNPLINYAESRRIDDHDNNYEASIYTIDIYNKKISVAIGQLKDMYQKPVYDNLIQEASLYDSKIKEYPIMIEQLLKKIKELEIENTELKRQKNIITN